MIRHSRILLSTLVVLGVMVLCFLRQVDGYTGPTARVFGGESVVDQGSRYPWFVRTSVCGGALIAPRLVLTASHCVLASSYFMGQMIGGPPHKWTLEEARKVIIGEFVTVGPTRMQYKPNKNEAYAVGGERRKIVDVLLPSNFSYKNRTLSNDIALLVLDQPSTKQYVKISSKAVPLGSIVSVIGHGKTSVNSNIESLQAQKGDAIAINNNECVKMLDAIDKKTAGRYATLIAQQKILANSRNYVCLKSPQNAPNTACHGDSGGPSFFDKGDPQSDVLIGCVSGGATACDLEGVTLTEGVQFRTSVYANLAWIKKVAQKLGQPLNIV